MSDMMTIKEAADFTGRGERTIRRWMAGDRLTVQRIEGDKRGKVLLSRQEVIDVASEMTPMPKKRSTKHDMKLVTEALRDHLDDTRRQRDAFDFELKGCRQELEELRRELTQKQKRIEALELELNSGVRGLLRRFNPLR